VLKACRKLEIIHYDLSGPVLIPFVNRNTDIMYFIDDYTMMCWIYLLKDKSQAFKTFKKIHVWIQNEAQSHVDTIPIDNGGEYTSNEQNIFH